MTIWVRLGIDETKDKEVIKAAYRERVVRVHPEEDPEGFKQLRAAYEEAIALADTQDAMVEKDNSPLGLWMQKVEDIYHHFSLRRDKEVWKTLLQEEICFQLDTMEEVSHRLLTFLMDYYYLPHSVWQVLDAHFDWQQKKEELYEDFPYQFVDYVIKCSIHPEYLDYDLFEIVEGIDYDKVISTYYNLERALNYKEEENAKTYLEEIKEWGVASPYITILEARYFLMVEDIEGARVLGEEVIGTLPEDITAIYLMAEVDYQSGNIEGAKTYYEKIQAINPSDLHSKIGAADCYAKQGEFKKAKHLYMEGLAMKPYENYIKSAIYNVNEKLIEEYKELCEQDKEDQALKFKLAWCYYENFHNEDCRLLAETIIPSEEDLFQYYDLQGKNYSVLGHYEEALGYFTTWAEKETEKGYVYLQQGKQYQHLERYQEALACFDKALEKDPEDVDVISGKAYTLYQLGDYEKAIAFCDKALEISQELAVIYLTKANCLYELGYYRDAVENCENCVRLYPYFTDSYSLRMKIYFNVKDYEKILELAGQVESLEIEDRTTKLYKAKALRNTGCLEEGKKICLALLEEEETDDALHYELAIVYSDELDLERSMIHIDRAIELSPQELYKYYFKAYLYREKGEKELAIEAYDFTISQNPKDEFAYYNRAVVYEQMGALEKAIEGYRAVLEINPEHRSANNDLAEIYQRQEEDEKALEYFTRQLEVEGSEYYYINRGILYAKLKRKEEAKADYEEALKFNPNSVYAYNNIGCLYKTKKTYEEAAEYFKKAIEVMGEEIDFLKPYGHLGFCYRRLGRYEDAFACYDEALKKDPKQSIFYIYKGSLLKQLDRYEEALTVYKEGLVQDPENASFYHEIGLAYEALEAEDEALRCYGISLEMDPKQEMSNMYMARIYYDRKEYKKALTHYDREVPLDEDYAETYIQRAGTYIKLGKHKAAREDYKYALELLLKEEHKGACTYKRMGCCYKALKEIEKAKQCLEKAIEIACSEDNCFKKQCHEAYFAFGELYEEEGDIEKAKAYYKKARDIDQYERAYKLALHHIEQAKPKRKFSLFGKK